MAQLVFDIETVGTPLEEFDEVQQKYLLKLVEREETPQRQERKREEVIAQLNLWAFTAQVVAIGMLNVESGQGRVYYQSAEQESWQEGQVQYESASEPEILGKFWHDIGHRQSGQFYYQQFITFNGRGFDCPFLMLRSALVGVKPTRNLMPYRYDFKIHCDLMEQFTFYGATRNFNLDFYCKAFGIESPKSHGITGLDMNTLFKEGKYREIAKYCFDDVWATAELYKRWREFLSFEG